MTKISICIPFYKGQDYLKLAVASVLRQTETDWDLVVVDNCGPESGTEDLIRSFNDPRLSYTRNHENIGLARNWNRCLELAKSPLVTLLHHDDELEADYLELMLKAASQYPDAAAYFCRTKIIGERGESKFSFPDFIKTIIMPSRDKVIVLEGEGGAESLMKGNFVFCPTLCYRKAALEGQIFSLTWQMVLDLEFIISLLLKQKKIVGIPQKAYRYRRHANNATVHLTAAMTRFGEEIDLHRALSVKFAHQGWRSAARVASDLRIIKLHLLYVSLQEVLRFRFSGLVKKIRFAQSKGLLQRN